MSFLSSPSSGAVIQVHQNEPAALRVQEPQRPLVKAAIPKRGRSADTQRLDLSQSALGWFTAICGTLGKLFPTLSLTVFVFKVGLMLVLTL